MGAGMISSARRRTNIFRSITYGACIAHPFTTTSIGSTAPAALSIYTGTEWDPLSWKQDAGTTIQVPSGNPNIQLIRVMGSQYLDTQAIGFDTREWDGTQYSKISPGTGFVRPVRGGDNCGVQFSEILAVSGGEKLEQWREQANAANAINDGRNWFGAEVVAPSTNYTNARKSGTTQSLGTSRGSITWDAADAVDLLNCHDPSVNPQRFTVQAGTTGKWRASAYIVGSAAIAGTMTVWITLNGVDVAKKAITFTAGTPAFNVVSPVLSVSTGDIVTFDAQFSVSSGIGGATNGPTMWADIEELPAAHRYCLVQKSATQTIPASTDTQTTWDGTDLWDPENLHDPTTNNGRILMAPGAQEARITYGLGGTSSTPLSWCNRGGGSGGIVSGTSKIDGLPCDGNGTLFHNAMGLWIPIANGTYFDLRAWNFGTIPAAGTTFFQVEFR